MQKVKKIKLVIIIGIICVCFIGNIPINSYASKLSDINEKIDAKKSEENKKKGKSKALQGEISDLQSKINKREGAVATLSSKIANIESEIIKKQKTIKKKQKSIEKQEKELGQRLRAMYEAGSSTIFDVIFGSSSITDFISNLGFVKKIHESDSSLLKDFKKEKKKLAIQKEALDKQQAELNSQIIIQQKEEKVLASDQAKIKTEKNKVDSDIKEIKKEIDAMRAESERIRSMLANFDDSSLDIKNPSTGWLHPFPSYKVISSGFGNRGGGFHQGIDLAGPYGGTIKASASGKVISAGYRGSYGNCVFISHGNGIVSIYAHMSSISVSNGSYVNQGDKVGECGSTGNSTGNHLHYEIRRNGTPINPSGYM